MSYGQTMLARSPNNIHAGESFGVFLVVPSVYSDCGIIYVREGSMTFTGGNRPIYKIRFRLKDGA